MTTTALRPLLICASLSAMLCGAAHAADAARPDVINFGTDVETMASNLNPLCSAQTFRELDPPPVPGITSRSQIDCEGFDYFGAPRLAEFVFLNNELAMVWVLVEEAEIPALETSMDALHGDADISNTDIDVYLNANAGVRRDVPEALFYAETIEPLIQAQASSRQ